MNRLKYRTSRILSRIKSADQVFMVIIPIIIGLFGGLGAALLRFLIHFFQDVFWKPWAEQVPWYQIIAVPAAGALIVGFIVYFFSQEAKGHGVPEVMEAISLRNGVIRPRVVLSKAVASSITIASGGSVGREGPIIQIGSAIGSGIGQIFKLSAKRMKTLVGCGAAAGIAAAFNAPIAGAMFSVEIILGDFAVSQFTPIVISSVSATVVSRFFYGNHPAFSIPKYDLVNPVELIPYALLGLICGAVGLLYIKVLYYFEEKYDAYKVPDYIKTLSGGIILGIIGLSFPQVFGVGYEALDQALSGGMELWLFFILIFVKILATSVTLGSGCSGGIFAPSLFMGAMTGGFFGTILHRIFPNVTAGGGAYALVAMSALVGATTHAPITAIMIIFEMTGDYKIILPLMIATTISTLFLSRIHKGSIYTLKLMNKGINLHKGVEINVLKNMTVKDIVRPDIQLIKSGTPLNEVITKFINTENSYCYITDETGRIKQKISEAQLSSIAPDYENLKDFILADDLATPNPLILKDNEKLDNVMKEFSRKNVGEIPVVSADDPAKIIGTVWRIDLIDTYNKEVLKRDMAVEVSKMIVNKAEPVIKELTDGLCLLEMEIPDMFLNRRIRDLDVRNKFSVDIMMIKKRDANSRIKTTIPHSAYRFIEEDIILVIGEREKIEKFRDL